MKKLLLILICMFVSNPCFSKWEKWFENEKMIGYVNSESIIKGEDKSFFYQKSIYKDKFWEGLESHRELGSDKYVCSLQYQEIDCKNFMNRTLQIKYYEDSNCSRLTRDGEIGDWWYPEPSSLLGELNRQICKK